MASLRDQSPMSVLRIVEFSARNPVAVVIATLLLAIAGFLAMRAAPFDALPDLSETQVIVYAKWDRSPEIIDAQITRPGVAALMGLPRARTVRSTSDMGFALIHVIFEDGTDLYWARSRIVESLARLERTLPRDATLEIGPDASSVGWIYQYALDDPTGELGPAELRRVQDTQFRFALQSVPGVAEVASIGGFEKQLQIKLDPSKLVLFGLSPHAVMEAVAGASQDASARTLEYSGAEAMIRLRGQVKGPADLETLVVSSSHRGQAPVTLGQVAQVSFGGEMRRGVGDLNGLGDRVSGIVVMRQGEDAPRVIAGVKSKLDELSRSLPPSVRIVPVYDRSELNDRAFAMIRKTLVQEILVVSLIILLFLRHVPSTIVPVATLPIAVLLSFIPLYFLGTSSSLMLLAGIAISVGVLVDGAIVEVENAARKVERWNAEGRKGDFFAVRLEAILEVAPSVFYSLLVVAAAFVPVLALVDREGKLFQPLALSKTFCMLAAAGLSLTFDPALRMLLSRAMPLAARQGSPARERGVPRLLAGAYERTLRAVLARPRAVLAAFALCFACSLPVLFSLGREFMPPLDEGSILYMPTSTPGLSIAEAQRLLTRQDAVIKSFDEVESVYGKAGRAETATDNAPVSMIETIIRLKPRSQCKRDITEAELLREMDAKLSFPGMPNIWTAPIQNRIDMLSTGVRTPVGLRVHGASLEQIQEIGARAEKLLKEVPGARSIVLERVSSAPYLDIDFDRVRLAERGITIKAAQDQVAALVGGMNAAETTIDGQRVPIQVRLAPDFRQDFEAIRRIPIAGPSGSMTALGQLAEVSFASGPAMIRGENARLAGYVYADFDPSRTSLSEFIANGKAKLAEGLTLPVGASIEWTGQFESLKRAELRLLVILPVVLLVIVGLLYLNLRSWVKTGIVLLALPASLIGAVALLAILGHDVSVATWVGMIALLGLDAETGVFMLMYLELAHREAKAAGTLGSEGGLENAVVEGAAYRLRPKLMTVSALLIGLVPILFASGPGSDVLKRIAAPMIGGLTTSFALELLLYPVLFHAWKKRSG